VELPSLVHWTRVKAVSIVPGDPPRLAIVDLPKPVPAAGHALIRVISSGLNRADLLQRRGSYPPPQDAPADIPGLEFAGIVESLGEDISPVKVGQRVFGLCSGGAHAEYIASPQALLMAVPERLTDIEAGATPEAYITAHDALVTQAAVKPGERVLVHAIGSGVGIAALQIATALGCEVFGTARSADKLKRARSLGATFACAPDAFDEAILTFTHDRGMDVILDPVGAPYFERDMRILALRGRLVIIATMGGTAATLALPVLMHKRLRIFGSMLRTRSIEEKAAATRAFERDVLPKLAAGELKVVIDKTFPLEQANAAYDYMEANQNFGKIVLTLR
jgi:NADPH2:quinone reductase